MACCPLALADPPPAPTNLVATGIVFRELVLTWEDNSEDEEGFILQVQTGPDAWFNILTTEPDVTETPLFGGNPAATDVFRVVAIRAGEEAPSNEVSYTGFDAFVSADRAHIRPAEPFSFTAVANNVGNAVTIIYTATGLPEGLSMDPSSGEISGTTTDDGFFEVFLEANYEEPVGPPARERFLLRIAPVPQSPIVEAPLPVEHLIPAGGPGTTISLGDHFEDPDTRIAVRIGTTAGDMDFSLFDRAMPLPVENFLNYVDRNDYADNVFHRSVNAATFDIIQSGGFHGDADGLTRVETDPAIVNAPGIPNDRGTLAYARTSNPDSATSGWYINAEDSPGLDVGDSYAVFGRITEATASVMDTIFAFPTGTHSIDVNGFNQSFNDFPTTDGNAPTNGPPSNLITVENITRIPALVFAVDSNSTPSIASAHVLEVEGLAQLEILPLSPGTTDLIISATDIDGNTVTAPLTVQVEENYASWAAANGAGIPTDRSDAGSLTDLQEYGFGGDPTIANDDIGLLPAATSVEVEGMLYDAVTFRHRTNAGDLSYTVEASEDLEGWTTVWQTSDGFDDDAVVSSTDDGDFKVLTVRLPNTKNGTASIYLRSVITLSANE